MATRENDVTSAAGKDLPDSVAGRQPGVTSAVQLFALAQALGEALTGDDVAAALFAHAMDSLGASAVGLWLVVDDDTIRFSGGAGHQAVNGPAAVGDMPLGSDTPAAIAVRTGELIAFGSAGERNERWGSLAWLSHVAEAIAVVPLTARGQRIGCLHIGWADAKENFRPDTDLLWALANLAASALDRARLFEGERSAREALEFLSQGTRLMVSALDPREVVRALVALAVPRLAPWCAVYMAENSHLIRLAIEIGLDATLASELRESAPVPLDADVPLATAYRTGQPLFLKDVPADVVARTYPAGPASKVLSLGGKHWAALVLPVQASGQVIGVMSLVSPDWGTRLPTDVFYAAEGLAARAGVALRNAHLYREQVDTVLTLTEALLPDSVPVVDGLRFAPRYVPASGRVCGDWYEVETMPDGAVLVGIGDASGHGLPAAATMAKVRYAARGLAVAGIGPGRMLDHLSTMLSSESSLMGQLATSIYGLVDPRAGSGRWANAGHPPPIVVGRDRRVTTMDLVPRPPIGVAGPESETVQPLPAGSKVVLYTDGVFERKGEDPAIGIRRLIDLIEKVGAASEDDIADAVIAGRNDTDDSCVLVVGVQDSIETS
jgi:GAF domain-containing protein